MGLGARNVTRDTVLASRLEVAGSLWQKFKGLMGRSSLDEGAGLWLPDSNGIHMMFMKFPIDAVFVGRPTADDPLVRPVASVHRACVHGPGSCRSSAARTACWSCRSGRSRRPGRSPGTWSGCPDLA